MLAGVAPATGMPGAVLFAWLESSVGEECWCACRCINGRRCRLPQGIKGLGASDLLPTNVRVVYVPVLLVI